VEAIADILRELRVARGFDVATAAEEIGVHRSTVYAWEAAEKTPEPAQLCKAVQVYEAPKPVQDRLAYLRGFGVEPTPQAA
jgi:transcriptional regulator with XRE-family HTH domain